MTGSPKSPETDRQVALNPHAEAHLRRVGNEGIPVLVIDDLVLNPEALVEDAAQAKWETPQREFYPGLNAPVPPAYIEAITHGLRRSFSRAFGFDERAHYEINSFFALSTFGLDQLGPPQRIPHYDLILRQQLAMVHYLGHDQGGGTALFRHNATGFEYVDAQRRDIYQTQIDSWMALNSDKLTAFTGPKTPSFTLTERVDFKFNRAVIYPSCALHCALFDGARLDPDPRTGRLTLNTFILVG